MRPKGGTLSHWDVLKRHELTGSVFSYQALQPLESLQSPRQQEEPLKRWPPTLEVSQLSEP